AEVVERCVVERDRERLGEIGTKASDVAARVGPDDLRGVHDDRRELLGGHREQTAPALAGGLVASLVHPAGGGLRGGDGDRHAVGAERDPAGETLHDGHASSFVEDGGRHLRGEEPAEVGRGGGCGDSHRCLLSGGARHQEMPSFVLTESSNGSPLSGVVGSVPPRSCSRGFPSGGGGVPSPLPSWGLKDSSSSSASASSSSRVLPTRRFAC